MTGLSGSGPRAAVLLRIATASPIALWFGGFGDIAIPANSLDAGGQVYQGRGLLVNLPELNKTLNGVADRGVFTLSGVPAEVADLAAGEADDVIGVAVNVGVVMLDDALQVVGVPMWLWDGRADVLQLTKSAERDASQNHSIGLSVGTAHTGRSRAEFANWTDAQHQRAHPGDTFFDHVPTGEKTKRWPGG